MDIHEYGDGSLDKIILLHPMGLNGQQLYQIARQHATGSYCWIVPDEGGHGTSGAYQSLQQEIDTLKDYLLERGYTDIRLLYGASMGTTVAYALLQDARFHFHRIWLDGGWFAPRGGIVLPLMRLMFLRIRAQAVRHPETPPPHLLKSYGEAFADIMTPCFVQLSRSDILRICNMYGHRALHALPDQLLSRICLEWGASDPSYRMSKKHLQKWFPGVVVSVRDGYGHCEYMAAHTQEYIRQLEQFAQQP